MALDFDKLTDVEKAEIARLSSGIPGVAKSSLPSKSSTVSLDDLDAEFGGGDSEPYEAPVTEPGTTRTDRPMFPNAAVEPEEKDDKDDSLSDALKSDIFKDKSATGLGISDMCPRCGHKRGVPILAEPTEADKQEFIRSILGNRRFFKSISLLSGKITFTFRDLTVAEADSVEATALRLARDGKLRTLEQQNTYRSRGLLVCMLERISSSHGVKDLPEIASYAEKARESNRSDLEEAVETVVTGMNTSLLALAGQAVTQFRHVVETLRLRSGDPDFYAGIREE